MNGVIYVHLKNSKFRIGDGEGEGEGEGECDKFSCALWVKQIPPSITVL